MIPDLLSQAELTENVTERLPVSYAHLASVIYGIYRYSKWAIMGQLFSSDCQFFDKNANWGYHNSGLG